jgi:hypothetical protein
MQHLPSGMLFLDRSFTHLRIDHLGLASLSIGSSLPASVFIFAPARTLTLGIATGLAWIGACH